MENLSVDYKLINVSQSEGFFNCIPPITVYYHQAPDEREKRLRGVPVMSAVIRGEEQIRQKQSSKNVDMEQTLSALKRYI